MYRKLLFIALFGLLSLSAFAEGTEFTYQGRLNVGTPGTPANTPHDFEFRLYTAPPPDGTLVGSPLTRLAVPVENGLFSVKLDFGNQFPGASRYLEISVRPTGGGTFTTLLPRTLINSTPYSIKSLSADTATNATNAATATNALQLGGVAADQYLLTTSSNYIRSSTTQQSADFNISGNGTVGGAMSGTQYTIGSRRVLIANGPDTGLGFLMTNTFVGDGAGISTKPGPTPNGLHNSFFGNYAGTSNRTGAYNSFFGSRAGFTNDASFNPGGSENSFFGESAGSFNSSGTNNSFFGRYSGLTNSQGGNNSFFGRGAGYSNSAGNENTIIGTSGDFNVGNFTGAGNTLLGTQSRATANLSNQTAIGFRALVTQANSLVLGSINNVNGATADTNVGIGTTAPAHRLHVVGDGVFENKVGIGRPPASNFQLAVSGTSGGIVGFGDGGSDPNLVFGIAGEVHGSAGNRTAVFGMAIANPGVVQNVGIQGFATGNATTNIGVHGSASLGTNNWAGYFAGDTFVGGKLRVQNGSLTAVSIAGNGSFEIDTIGTAGGRFKVAANGLVTVGTAGVGGDLTVYGNSLINTLTIANGLTVNVLGAAGTTSLCRNASNQISNCSSSLRYKENVIPLLSGSDLVGRLRPVSFEWKQSGDADIGLVAEEVAKVETQLVTRNEKGEIEGVRYDRIGVLLINAVKEQQTEIESLRKRVADVEALKREVAELRALLCARNAETEMCKK